MNVDVEDLVNTILIERSGEFISIDQSIKDILVEIFPENSKEYRQIMYVVSHPKFMFWMTEYDYDNKSQKIVWRSITYPFNGFYEFNTKNFNERGYDYQWNLDKELELKYKKQSFEKWSLIDKLYYMAFKNRPSGYSTILSKIRNNPYGTYGKDDMIIPLRKIFVACLDISLKEFELGPDYIKIKV